MLWIYLKACGHGATPYFNTIVWLQVDKALLNKNIVRSKGTNQKVPPLLEEELSKFSSILLEQSKQRRKEGQEDPGPSQRGKWEPFQTGPQLMQNLGCQVDADTTPKNNNFRNKTS